MEGESHFLSLIARGNLKDPLHIHESIFYHQGIKTSCKLRRVHSVEIPYVSVLRPLLWELRLRLLTILHLLHHLHYKLLLLLHHLCPTILISSHTLTGYHILCTSYFFPSPSSWWLNHIFFLSHI